MTIHGPICLAMPARRKQSHVKARAEMLGIPGLVSQRRIESEGISRRCLGSVPDPPSGLFSGFHSQGNPPPACPPVPRTWGAWGGL